VFNSRARRSPRPVRSAHDDGKERVQRHSQAAIEAYAGKAKIAASRRRFRAFMTSNIRGQTLASQGAPDTRTVNHATWERLVLGAKRPIRRLTPNTRDASVRALRAPIPANKAPDAKSSTECWAHFAPRR